MFMQKKPYRRVRKSMPAGFGVGGQNKTAVTIGTIDKAGKFIHRQPHARMPHAGADDITMTIACDMVMIDGDNLRGKTVRGNRLEIPAMRCGNTLKGCIRGRQSDIRCVPCHRFKLALSVPFGKRELTWPQLSNFSSCCNRNGANSPIVAGLKSNLIPAVAKSSGKGFV